jgi:thymidylate synthase (FAD)
MKTEPRVQLIACTTIIHDVPGYVNHEDELSTDLTYSDDLGEQAGRLCYESWDRPNPSTATNEGYLANIIKQSHYSVMEHSSATFYVDGVTRNFTHELIRHRHLSFSEVSQRYCDVSKFDFVVHPGLSDLGEKAQDALRDAIAAGQMAYWAIMKDLTERGVEGKQARQAARHALVSGTETKIIVTGNMRAWREMLVKRLSPAADAEFRRVAELMRIELKLAAPNTFQDFVN